VAEVAVPPAFSGASASVVGRHDLDDPVGVGFIGILLDEFALMFQRYAGYAWSTLAKEDEIVKRKFPEAPSEGIFSERELPALCLWCHEIDAKAHSTGFAKRTMLLKMAWIPPPTVITKEPRRANFYVKLDAIVTNMVLNGVSSATDGTTLGPSLRDKAGLQSLAFAGKTVQQEARFESGVTVHKFPIYVWSLLATDLTAHDLEASYRQAHALRDPEFLQQNPGATPQFFSGEHSELRLSVNSAGHPAHLEARDSRND